MVNAAKTFRLLTMNLDPRLLESLIMCW